MSTSATSPRTSARFDRAYATVWVATLLFFGAFYALIEPLPRYLVQVGLADWEIGVVLSAFGVAALVGRPLAGLAADRWGQRPVLLAGTLALLVGAVAVPMTSSAPALFALRLLQTAGYVAFTTAGTALVIRLTPPEIRGRRLAIFGAAANVALTLTPAVTSAALASAPVTAAFYVSGLLALVAGVLALRLRGGAPSERAQAGGHQGTARHLLLPMVATALVGAGFAAFLQFSPLLAERRGGLAAGLLFTIYGLGIIATRVLTGPLLDRWSIQRTLTLAATLLAGGLGLLALGGPPAGAAVAALLVAVGSGLSHPALLAHHAALLPAAPGRASAAFYIGFDLGIGLGSALFGVALELGGLTGLYGAAALLTLAALPLAPLLGRIGVR
ncbi:MAG: MFS transporter [Chloroflexota bacterium]